MAKSSCLMEIRDELLSPKRPHVSVAGREYFPRSLLSVAHRQDL